MTHPCTLQSVEETLALDTQNDDKSVSNEQIFGWTAGWKKIPEENMRPIRGLILERGSKPNGKSCFRGMRGTIVSQANLMNRVPAARGG